MRNGATGGLVGKQLILRLRDNRYDPKQAVAIANELVFMNPSQLQRCSFLIRNSPAGYKPYFPATGSGFACRSCHGLAYASTQR
jgi:hypothetical protein